VALFLPLPTRKRSERSHCTDDRHRCPRARKRTIPLAPSRPAVDENGDGNKTKHVERIAARNRLSSQRGRHRFLAHKIWPCRASFWNVHPKAKESHLFCQKPPPQPGDGRRQRGSPTRAGRRWSSQRHATEATLFARVALAAVPSERDGEEITTGSLPLCPPTRLTIQLLSAEDKLGKRVEGSQRGRGSRRQCARGPTESCLTLAAIKHRGRGKAGGARTVVPGQGGSANGCRWPRGRAAALRVHRGLSSPLYVVGVSFVGTGDRILGCGPRASLDWMDGATELVGRLSTGAWDDEPDACWTILRPIAPSVSAGTTKPMRVGRKQ
jgi:hypothetical protein